MLLSHAKHDVKYPAGAAAAAVDLNVAYRMSWRICRSTSEPNSAIDHIFTSPLGSDRALRHGLHVENMLSFGGMLRE
ncbi:hypothetical protein F2Q68_00038344 [Brassica cretica]|uniref:Uncharacterized protein n=1 Tax=Brassica cretica TaxID=69181 RepID=A0A8S9MH94_BRACR|nr:hypothetical protein F2Q68_00038344 [Brassica cretica]